MSNITKEAVMDLRVQTETGENGKEEAEGRKRY